MEEGERELLRQMQQQQRQMSAERLGQLEEIMADYRNMIISGQATGDLLRIYEKHVIERFLIQALDRNADEVFRLMEPNE